MKSSTQNVRGTMRETMMECDLPGIGRKYTFTAASGEHFPIVLHKTRNQELLLLW
jgi:K+/H+ antiporter YhaU regulatory subunit KhtT